LNEIKVHRTAGQIITLEGGFDNVKVYGASNASVPQAYFNMQKKLLNFKLEIPKLRLSSSYKLKGKFLCRLEQLTDDFHQIGFLLLHLWPK
jgi:hypothetical protein